MLNLPGVFIIKISGENISKIMGVVRAHTRGGHKVKSYIRGGSKNARTKKSKSLDFLESLRSRVDYNAPIKNEHFKKPDIDLNENAKKTSYSNPRAVANYLRKLNSK